MSVKINFDTAGNVEQPTLVLAYKSGHKIGNIQNATSVVFNNPLAGASSFSFREYKVFDDNVYRDWDKLVDFKTLYIPEWDLWYSIKVDLDVNDETVKNVSADALGDSELSQVNLYDIEINTESDIAREDYDVNLPTVFYRPKHPEASLMDRITEKVPNYTIKHIDTSLMNIQKTFSFNGISIRDAFNEIEKEIGCLIKVSSCSDVNGFPERGIYAYDLEDVCMDCGYRNVDMGSLDMKKCPKCGSTNIKEGYGEDTTIFISRDNLADNINYTTDDTSVKNCFKLVAGDDLMTAAVRACNPNGSDYIWMFSEEMKADMSAELQAKIKEYDVLYENYQSKATIPLSSNLLTQYNQLINKYKAYAPTLEPIPTSVVGYPQLMKVYFETIDMVLLLESTLMPNITLPTYNAQQQIDKLMAELPSAMGTTSVTGLSQSTADNIVLSYARSVVYSGFKVEIGKSSLNGTTWSGNFVITSYSDEKDKATSGMKNIAINDNYQEYIKQRLDKILNRKDKDIFGIVALFEQNDTIFKSELRKYSLNRLNSFYAACQACIDIMVQAKVSEANGKHTDVYTALYVPYLNKLQFISDEIKVRDNEIRIVQGYYNNQGKLVFKGLQQELIEKRDEIQNALNYEKFLGTTLWKEFLSFRREDEYSNGNYISDGLSNAELLENAKEFIIKATKELYKSCHLQHSISSSLKNFLRMKEFAPILEHFEVGNWIRVEIDEKIYKLRLVEYEIDFEDLDNISVTFSDVERLYDGYSDLQSIYDKTSSLATSYDSVKHQIDSNKNNLNRLDNWVAKGLDMTNTKIVSDAQNQNIMWDEHGLLCREYNDILGDYNPDQLKVINNGIYITDDNWKHTRTGFGKFIYFDPKDGKYKEGYGVIADTIVSNIILSEEVGIYNTEKSIELGKNGIVVTTNTLNKNVFTIQKEYTDEKGNVFKERQFYIDDNGNVVLGGGASISWENVTGTGHIATNTDMETLKKNITQAFDKKLNVLEQQSDKKAETWYQATDPKLAWTDKTEKDKHNGDLWFNTTTSKSYIYNSATDSWDELKTTPPKEVFDKIDGKAQTFVSQPVPPYNVGDLWFNSTTSDIMTCVTSRPTGVFTKSDWEKRNKYTDNTELNNFVNNTYPKDLQSIQAQIDGQIETFYYDYEPTLQNAPASQWTTEKDKEKHVGDLFFWKSKGFAYRFLKDGINYVWQLVKDTDVTTALENAQKAQDTADGKRRVFVNTPTTPYDVGDLWTQGNNGKLMRCKIARLTGTYNAADWEEAVGYTDDKALTDFLNGQYVTDKNLLKEQIDGKVQTYRQEADPSLQWTPDEKAKHVGDLWYKLSTNETFMYNGTSWDVVTGEIPKELWDKVDGKAQVFTTEPVPPYDLGDLWVQGTTGDIMKCIVAKPLTTDTYNAMDWDKASKYTDDAKVDDVITGLGFSTLIDGTKVISPHIVGGDLKIGDPNKGTYYAEIDSAGKLTAKKAVIEGDITASSGKIGNFNIGTAIWSGMETLNSGVNGVYLGTDGIALGGGNFKVTSGGKLTATDANITGTINATDGSFTGTIHANGGEFKGAVHATSLTLGTGVTIDYGNISNTPPSMDTTAFIRKDGTIGSNPSEGATGFKVSSNGLLQASNAIIYGDIYASGGTIGGFSISTSLDSYTHKYKNTLYRIAKRVLTDGTYYDYQAGIKGIGDGEETDPTEATFYVRRKLSSDATWNNSTLPFYVRNNGQVYVQDLTIENALYTNGGSSNRFKVIDSTSNEIYLGSIGKTNGNHMFMRFSYTPFNSVSQGSMSFQQNLNGSYISPFGIYKTSATELTYNIVPNGNWVMTHATVNLGSDDATHHRFNCLYVNSIKLGNKLITDWSQTGSGSGGGATIYTSGVGIKIEDGTNNNKIISVKLADAVNGGIGINNYNNLSVNKTFLNNWGDGRYATQAWANGQFSLSNHNHNSTYTTEAWVKNYISTNVQTITGNYVSSIRVDRNLGVLYYTLNGGNYEFEWTLPSGGGSSNELSYNGYTSEWSLQTDSKSTYLVFRPYSQGNYKAYLGDGSYRWQKLNCNVAPEIYSDANLKQNVSNLYNNPFLDELFMKLNPVSFNFKYDIDDGELHYGLIAQEVESLFSSYGVDIDNLNLISKTILKNPNKAGKNIEYSLAYEEFIPLNIMMTQKAHHRIDDLEKQNQELKSTLLQLQGEISILKQKLGGI